MVRWNNSNQISSEIVHILGCFDSDIDRNAYLCILYLLFSHIVMSTGQTTSWSLYTSQSPRSTYDRYQTLDKPSWAPAPYVYGRVWWVLYPLIFFVLATVIYKRYHKQIPTAVLTPFVLNIIFNLAFTPIQFWLKNNFLAVVDIVLVLVTIVWAMYVIYPYHKRLTRIQVPYLIRVTIATVLMIQIWLLNR